MRSTSIALIALLCLPAACSDDGGEADPEGQGGTGGGQGGTAGSSPQVERVPLRDVVSLAAQGGHACALKGDGSVWCWGSNDLGQLGNDRTTARDVAVRVAGLPAARSLAAGGEHNCAVLEDGTVQCWGSNEFGQLGNGEAGDPSPTPVTVEGIVNPEHLTADFGFTCAAVDGGSVRCWGVFGTAQAPVLSPMEVANVDGIVALDASFAMVCGALDDGETDCWPIEEIHFVELSDVVQANLNTFASCALLTDGTVLSWGNADIGQLGREGAADPRQPGPIPEVEGATSIACDSYRSAVLFQDGTLQHWGGAPRPISTPEPVPDIDDAVAVVSNASFSCALRSDTTVSCWGAPFIAPSPTQVMAEQAR